MNYLKATVNGMLGAGITIAMLTSWSPKPEAARLPIATCSIKGCVFRTIMGEEPSDSAFVYSTPENVGTSLQHALQWIAQAQQPDGGFGAGSHIRQDIMDPHVVPSDPATTAMVGMALLRNGNTLNNGLYHTELRRALEYTLTQVENAPLNSSTITTLTGTQIQVKLGSNIDVVLAAQFLSNIAGTITDNHLKERVLRDLNTCVSKIQMVQQHDGSTSGAGWAGVLQSAFAANALESAESNGADVDKEALKRARDYQKGNYNAGTGDVKTDMGAGVMLYAVSGSTRASAKEARMAREAIEKAEREGTLPQGAPVTADNLEVLGYSKDDALNFSTAYGIYESAKYRAQEDRVMNGFGSNGGEEFLSYLQTGESMIIGKDDAWKQWYDNMSGRLIRIQNENGSWNGHHCITSPVFCTATCLLILAVNNDIDKLLDIGAN